MWLSCKSITQKFKKMKKVLSITIIIIGLVFSMLLPISCQKQIEVGVISKSPEETLAAMIVDGGDPTVEDYFLLRASQLANPVSGNNTSIDAIAVFTDEQKKISAGTISVNGRQVTQNPNKTYHLEYINSLFNEGDNFQGNQIEVNIGGNPSQMITASLIRTYVPKYLITSPFDLPTSHINKSNGVLLKWQPDPLNLTGKIYIQVYYYGGISQSNNPSLPSAISSVSFAVPDNGSFRIPATSLTQFPIDAYIGISLGRGVQYMKNFKDPSVPPKNVYYFNIVDAKTIPLIVRF
jgi:hypothetical protein